MTYQPPKDIWEACDRLKFDEPLEAGDPRFVDTSDARGDMRSNKLLHTLGVNPESLELNRPPDNKYCLYFGHRGCGKSTELKRLAANLHGPDKFYVVLLDAMTDLDTNNLQYPDMIMAIAAKLCSRLDDDQVAVDKEFMTNLKDWFKERIVQNEQVKTFGSEVAAGVKGKASLPFLAGVFGRITTAFKSNNTHKEMLRQIVKNTITQLSDDFNRFIQEAESAIVRQGKGRKLLFIVDGADRLSQEDSQRFFFDDIHQLQLLQSNFIYTARINLLYQGPKMVSTLEHFMLPMIKLTDKTGQTKQPPGYEALRKLVYLRFDPSLFDSADTVDYLIEFSGGSPRELLHLLSYSCQNRRGDILDRRAAEQAVRDLAADFRRILNADDFSLLCQVDKTEDESLVNGERAKDLLYNTAIFEYNSFWWRTHPVIQTLPAYQACLKAEGTEG